jgi:hypothetical protein
MLIFHTQFQYFRGHSKLAAYLLWHALIVDQYCMLCELYPRCIIYHNAGAFLRTGYFEFINGRLDRYGMFHAQQPYYLYDFQCLSNGNLLLSTT